MVWKGGSRIPAPFQRESLIPKVCHHYPKNSFLSQHRILRFPRSSQVSHPVRVFQKHYSFPAIKWLVELHFMDIGFQRLQQTVLLGSNGFDTQRKFLKLTRLPRIPRYNVIFILTLNTMSIFMKSFSTIHR